MRLKIRNKDKNLFIETLNEQSLFKDLTETISNLTGIPPLHQECMKRDLQTEHIYFFFTSFKFFLVNPFFFKSKNRISAKSI